MRRPLLAALILVATSALADDLADARAVFLANLDAIAHRDVNAYLATYLDSDAFVLSTPSGLRRGYAEFAKQRTGWTDTFKASDVDLVLSEPGVAFGTYRYRITVEGKEHVGTAERLLVKTPAGWKIAATGSVDAPPGTPPPPRAIAGATLIDGRGGPPVPNANVIVREGKIACAGTARDCPIPAGMEIVDGKGMWLTPGLIDAHVHFSQTGWADGRPDALDVRAAHPYEKTEEDLKSNPERFARSYVCSGVTSVFDVGGYPWTLKLEERFRNDTLAPHVVAAGPLLSTLDHWLNLPAERQFIAITSEDIARSGVRYLAAQGSKAIKVWYIVNPNLPVEKNAPIVAAAGDEAAKAGLPLIVHATGLAEAKAALRAGAKLLVHSVDDAPLDAEFIELAKKNGTILIPTLTVSEGYMRMFHAVIDRKAPAVDDPNRCVDPGTLAKVAETATVEPGRVDPKYVTPREQRAIRARAIMAGNLMALLRAGIPIATGTDAGNPLTLHGPAIYAEMETMQADGMSPMQVIVSSTAVASRAMGIDKVTGTIESGKDADLLLLGADPSKDVANFRNIRYVVRGGEVRDIAYLSRLAQGR